MPRKDAKRFLAKAAESPGQLKLLKGVQEVTLEAVETPSRPPRTTDSRAEQAYRKQCSINWNDWQSPNYDRDRDTAPAAALAAAPLLQFYHNPLNPRRHPLVALTIALTGSDWLPKLTADLHGAASTAVVPATLVVSLAATVALDTL